MNQAAARDTALTAVRDAVALWYVGQSRASDVVLAACDLLVAGFDSPTLRELASVPLRHADVEIDPMLDTVFLDLGLTRHPRESPAAEKAALVAMARCALSQTISPRYLTHWTHVQFGHDRLDTAEELARLDDEYDYNEFNGEPIDEIDAQVLAEAQRIVSQNENVPGPTGPGTSRITD